jgi:hypothetical protein
VSLKDTWFTANAETLLQPIGASASYAVAGKAISEVVVQPGQKVDIQVRRELVATAAVAIGVLCD